MAATNRSTTRRPAVSSASRNTASRPRPSAPRASAPRSPRPPTAAQLAARAERERIRQAKAVERERERQAKANQREREKYLRMRQRQSDQYHKALAAQAARVKREQIAREKQQLREQERKIAQQLHAQQQRQTRDYGAAGRAEYARLAKEKPYERYKYRGQPAPILGPMRTTVNLSDAAGAAKIRGRLPKLAETPAQERERNARNELRVRQLRGIFHDAEIDLRHAEYAYKATKPGTKGHEQKRAAYERARAAYHRAYVNWQQALHAAMTGPARRASSRGGSGRRTSAAGRRGS